MDSLDKLLAELDDLTARSVKIKKAINAVCEVTGEPLRFPEAEDASSVANIRTLRPDQFFGKPLATAAKEFLKMKGSAANLEEIYEALVRGGYEFTGKQSLWKRGLSISLAKNSATFVNIRNTESFGLPEFYPNYKAKKDKGDSEPEEKEEEAPTAGESTDK